MSILNLLSGQSEENTEGTTKLTNVGGALLLGGAAFSVAKKNDFFKNQAKGAFTTLTSNRIVPETAQAGQRIRSSVDILKEATEITKKEVLDKAKESLLKEENLEKILQSTDSDQAKAFLNAIYEEISGRELESNFDDIINQINSAVKNPDTLADKDRNLIKDFFKAHITTDDTRFGRFQSSYERRLKVSNLFERKDHVFQPIKTQIKQESFTVKSYSELINNNNNLSSTQKTNILNKVNKNLNLIKNMAGGGTKVDLVGYDEYQSGIRSLYARVSFSSSRTLNIPLHLQKNSEGQIFYRATENLSTRYQAPLKIIDANELLKGASLTTSSDEALQRASMDFDQYIFKSISSNLGNSRQFNNLSTRNINDINSFIRSFGIDVPRGMVYGTGSKRLNQQLLYSRVAQSGIGFIAGLENMDREQRKLVHRRLIQMFPEQFGGPPSSQTVLQRLENPFVRGSELMFKNVQLLNEGVASIEQMSVFGRLDRSIQPQTAREQQMYGRPEVIEKVYGVNRRKTISKFSQTQVLADPSQGDRLIGMKKNAKMLGINVANIIAFGDEPVEKLGLSEGMSLFGGNFQISSSITKTVVEEDLYQTKLMKKLIEAGKEGLTIGKTRDADISIKKFFEEYGDEEGRAILGKLDKEFSHIKRQGGVESMFLKITGFSKETGRTRYHISGNMQKNFRSGKAFGTFLKDTLKNVNKDVFDQYLERIGGKQLFRDVGLNEKTTVLTTNDFIKKSEQYLMTTMAGGLDVLGGNIDLLKKNLNQKIGDDKTFLNKINKRYKTQYKDLDLVPASQRAGTQLHEFITEFTKVGSSLGDSRLGTFAYTLSYAADLAKNTKFGLSKASFDRAVKAGLSGSGIDAKAFLTKIEDARKSGIMLGAGSMFAGTHHSELGRNLAKTEPRLANYLYSSLRSNFGFNPEEASSYIGSLVSRQQGIEGRANAIAGMQLMSESISNVSNKRITQKVNQLGLEKFADNEIEKLLQFGDRDKDLVDFLSKRKQGGILDLEKIKFKDKDAFNELTKALGGKTELYLPGSDVLENMIGHEIRTTQQVLDIEAEYKRGLGSLLSSISSFETAEGAYSINIAMKAVQASKKQLAKVTGTAMRESLSGRVLGSGSYSGAGLTLGGEGAEIYSTDKAIQKKINDKFAKVFNKEKGYLAFIDAQTYLDGMMSYRAALKKDFPGHTNKQIDELMTNSLKDFFLGMHRKEETGVSGLIQRNPTIGFGHYMPGMSLYRYDFDQNISDFDQRMFSILKEAERFNLKIESDRYQDLVKGSFESEKAAIKTEALSRTRKVLQEQGFDLDEIDTYLEKQKEMRPNLKRLKEERKTFNKNVNTFYGAYSGKIKKYNEGQKKFVDTGRGYASKHNQFKGISLSNLMKQYKKESVDARFRGKATVASGNQLVEEINERLSHISLLFPEHKDLFKTLSTSMGTDDFEHTFPVVDKYIKDLASSKKGEMGKSYGDKSLLSVADKRSLVKEEIDLAHKELKEVNKYLKPYFEEYNKQKISKKEHKQRLKQSQKSALTNAYQEANAKLEAGAKTVQGFEVEKVIKSKSLHTLETVMKDITGDESYEIGSFKDLSYIEDKYKNLEHTMQVTTKKGVKDKTYQVSNLVNRVMKDVMYFHRKYGESGGGLVRFPNVNLTADLVDESGQSLGRQYSGRMDYSRFAIGDYDADIYQIFFDTKRNLAGKMNKKGFESGGLYEYGAKFLISMEELGKGMEKLGERLGGSKLTLMESRISELEKERIIKDVGGLDVQVKTGMLGLVQASAESGDFNKAMRLRGSGAALVSVAQEVLAIKAKKLPLATDVASEFSNILREGFKTGEGAERLQKFFMDNILRETAFGKGSSISLKNVKLSALPDGAAKKAMEERLSSLKINMDEIFETFDVMFKTVHERGLQNFGSNSKMMNALNRGGQVNMDMLNFLFSKYGSMEGGFVGKEFDFEEFDNIMNRQQEVRKQLLNQFQMPKMGGLIGAALGASYLVGSMQSVSQLETDNKFSDMNARKSLSANNLYRSQENASKELPLQALGGPQNFYERPIHLNQSYVNLTKSQHIFAQAPTESSGAMMGKIMADAGGKSNFMIHDQRHRISQSEITRNLTS